MKGSELHHTLKPYTGIPLVWVENFPDILGRSKKEEQYFGDSRFYSDCWGSYTFSLGSTPTANSSPVLYHHRRQHHDRLYHLLALVSSFPGAVKRLIRSTVHWASAPCLGDAVCA